MPRAEKGAEVLLIRAVKEEEEVDDQYLPSPVSTDLDLSHLSEPQQSQVKPLINPDIFQEYPGCTTLVEHDIVLKPDATVRRMSYRIPAPPCVTEEGSGPHAVPGNNSSIKK